MIGGSREEVWDGEECEVCGSILHHEVALYDGCYFCSKKCLGEYLADKIEDDVEWIDFITQEEIDQREYEDWHDSMRDRDLWSN